MALRHAEFEADLGALLLQLRRGPPRSTNGGYRSQHFLAIGGPPIRGEFMISATVSSISLYYMRRSPTSYVSLSNVPPVVKYMYMYM